MSVQAWPGVVALVALLSRGYRRRVRGWAVEFTAWLLVATFLALVVYAALFSNQAP
jgi:hypothetical protein